MWPTSWLGSWWVVSWCCWAGATSRRLMNVSLSPRSGPEKCLSPLPSPLSYSPSSSFLSSTACNFNPIQQKTTFLQWTQGQEISLLLQKHHRTRPHRSWLRIGRAPLHVLFADCPQLGNQNRRLLGITLCVCDESHSGDLWELRISACGRKEAVIDFMIC